MKHEKSCGAVVYFQDQEQRKYLLIQHQNGGHWSFPKGHVEKNETEAETALREIQEETGLTVELDTDFRYSTQFSPQEGIIKDVIYFIAKAPSIEVKQQEEEVSHYQWLNYAEALKQITYNNDKELLTLVHHYEK